MFFDVAWSQISIFLSKSYLLFLLLSSRRAEEWKIEDVVLLNQNLDLERRKLYVIMGANRIDVIYGWNEFKESLSCYLLPPEGAGRLSSLKSAPIKALPSKANTDKVTSREESFQRDGCQLMVLF